MPLLFQKRIYRGDLRANPNVLYVFGDNEARVGLGGQAGEMRGEPNAIGIPTLAAPDKPWREDDTERQRAVVDRNFVPVARALMQGRIVIFPLDGIGTGIAELEKRAPSTFAHIQNAVEGLKLLEAVR